MSSWRSGRGLQWQPVKLWWTPCPRGLRQCWKIMVATQNIDTLGPIWTFSLRGVLTFVASGLDINGCVLSYFEGTVNLHCYTSCTLTTLHCSKVSFLQCCHMKRYNKIFTKCEGCTHFCEILYGFLAYSVTKLSNNSSKKQMINTCLSHLIVLLSFYVPKLVSNMLTRLGVVLTLTERNAILIIASLIPPLINPTVYCTRTKEIRKRLADVFLHKKVAPNNLKFLS